MEDTEIKKLLRLCRRVSQMVIQNGGETYRAEQTVMHICRAYGVESDVFATTTGIILSIQNDAGEDTQTALVRMEKRSTDLNRLNAVNDLSRRIETGEVSLDEALQEAERIAGQRAGEKGVRILAGGISGGFFTLLFGGNVFELCISILCGLLVQSTSLLFQKTSSTMFLTNLIGGGITALTALASVSLFGTGTIDPIIIGAIMPLLPGLALTNALRDTINGDLVSGVARGVEALLASVAIAVGVGVMLTLWISLGGGGAIVS